MCVTTLHKRFFTSGAFITFKAMRNILYDRKLLIPNSRKKL